MELKEFVKTTMEQILEGVIEVKKHERYYIGVAADSSTQYVEFEVLIGLTEGKNNETQIGVFLPKLNIGAGKKKEDFAGKNNLTKISFKVPYIWSTHT